MRRSLRVLNVLTPALASLLAWPAFAQVADGNAGQGASLFSGKGGCVSCHRVRDLGSRLGPDLSEIGTTRKPDELRKAIVDPAPQVQLQNRTYRVVTKDGVVATGKLLNQGTASLQMLDSNERLVSFQKAGLKEFSFVETPPMPSFRNKLSADEIEALVAYLSQLKGVSQ